MSLLRNLLPISCFILVAACASPSSYRPKATINPYDGPMPEAGTFKTVNGQDNVDPIAKSLTGEDLIKPEHFEKAIKAPEDRNREETAYCMPSDTVYSTDLINQSCLYEGPSTISTEQYSTPPTYIRDGRHFRDPYGGKVRGF